MRLERLNYNKIKIYLTLDDLFDRGLTKEDIWKDSLKWHQLFHDMLEEASMTLGVDIQGSIAVEVFTMQAQGMVLILTMGEQQDELFINGFIDMQVTLEGNIEILFEFDDFEQIIRLAKRLAVIGFLGGSLYYYKQAYYLLVENVSANTQAQVAAIMSEFGTASFISKHMLAEYGKTLIAEQAVGHLLNYFK